MPTPVEEIGDLLSHRAKYIAHQCNCVSQRARHLAHDVFSRFPYADVYSDRDGKARDVPGTIAIRGDGATKRFVINMFAQRYPSVSRFGNDTPLLRQKWFSECLEEISKIPDLESIAFPWCIGCGAAGGDWRAYRDMIIGFAEQVNATVFIVKMAP